MWKRLDPEPISVRNCSRRGYTHTNGYIHKAVSPHFLTMTCAVDYSELHKPHGWHCALGHICFFWAGKSMVLWFNHRVRCFWSSRQGFRGSLQEFLISCPVLVVSSNMDLSDFLGSDIYNVFFFKRKEPQKTKHVIVLGTVNCVFLLSSWYLQWFMDESNHGRIY